MPILTESNAHLLVKRKPQLGNFEQVRKDSSRGAGLKLPLTIGDLAAGATKYFEEDSEDLRPFRQFPFLNGFFCSNNSSVEVVIILDHSPARQYPVPASGVFTYDQMHFWSVAVKNNGTATALAGKVSLQAIYEPKGQATMGVRV